MLVFIITLLILGTITALLIQRYGGFRFPWLSFYIKGKESGFKLREINLLRRIAIDNKLKNPTALYWSEKILDRCIKNSIINNRAAGTLESPETVHLHHHLFEFRKQVEFNQPKYKTGLQSTRNIPPGQWFKLTMPGIQGVFVSRLVENNRKHLAASRPEGKALPPGFTWQGQPVNVYFWRAEDAGYYFESRILGDFIEKNYPIIHIEHKETLVRAQKRESIRASFSASANLYPLKNISQANEVVEQSSGYRCKMVDISEGGAAIVVGGRAKPGMPVKLQTKIGDESIVMCGTVRGITYKEKNNLSVMHIQAVQPSKIMNNRIRAFVYGLLGNESTRQSSLANTSSS